MSCSWCAISSRVSTFLSFLPCVKQPWGAFSFLFHQLSEVKWPEREALSCTRVVGWSCISTCLLLRHSNFFNLLKLSGLLCVPSGLTFRAVFAHTVVYMIHRSHLVLFLMEAFIKYAFITLTEINVRRSLPHWVVVSVT